MALPYSELVMEHFRNPQNVGSMEGPDGKAVEGSPACGDMVALYLKVNDATQQIEDVKFESYGCASNIATGSIITEMAKGKTLEEAKQISWQQASEALGGLPPVKVHCSVLAVDALRAAIQDYEERNGLVANEEPTTVDILRKRLRRVMNPVVGLDIVRTDVVREIKLDDGQVTILVDLSEDHQFAGNIKEEIIEKIEPLWDIETVTVEFVG